MLPDQGFYEERYRLTGSVALSLAVSLGMLAIALYSSQSILLALSALTFVAVTVPSLAAAAGRRIAFRADPLGLTLGAEPLSWPGRDSSPVFIPWSDVERIVLYAGPKSREPGASRRQCIGIQRRPGAPRLPRGNGPARRASRSSTPSPTATARALLSRGLLSRGRIPADGPYLLTAS
jgi:hypothetical protein